MPPSGDYRVLIEKRARRLRLLGPSGTVREHPIDIGRNAEADKHVEGDCATPLGEFFVCAKNPRSRWHRSLCLSYPNAEDADRGLRDGHIDAAEHVAIHTAIEAGRMPPQHTRLGGEIYIHGSTGLGSTQGCIALADAAIAELYELIALGTRVTILD